MPLLSGKKARTRKGFSDNIRKEMEAGKKQKQAVAIAYSQARKSTKGETEMRHKREHKSEHHKKAEHHKKKHDHHKEKMEEHREKMREHKEMHRHHKAKHKESKHHER